MSYVPTLPPPAAARARRAMGDAFDTYPKSGGLGGFFSQDGFATGFLAGAAVVVLAGMFGWLPGNKR